MNERQRRLIALTRLLTAHPRRVFTLSALAERWGVAKSTLSEDMAAIKSVLAQEKVGEIVTQVGSSGGVRYLPALDKPAAYQSLQRWSRMLAAPDRMTPEGFLYMTDLLFNPQWIEPMAHLLTVPFQMLSIDLVATVETKGIPLALACARQLDVEMVLIRRDSRLSEGSAVSINYLSGSSRRIQSMSLARRTPVRDRSILFVDDFMKAGGTAHAAQDLLKEFNARVVGVGVLVSTVEPAHKLVESYYSCLQWDDQKPLSVAPSDWALAACTD
ncbi:MAG: pur operon repressor [Firmicutes bacterium]|nr:pur operon repressor [Bacillota bacterium]